MSRRVEWAKRASKVLSRVDRPTQDRIVTAVDDLAESNQGDVRRLQGTDEEIFRLRVGPWRVIFAYLDEATILILDLSPRGDAYRR